MIPSVPIRSAPLRFRVGALALAALVATAASAASARAAPAAAPARPGLAAVAGLPVAVAWRDVDGSPPGNGGDPAIAPWSGPSPAIGSGGNGGHRPVDDTAPDIVPGNPGPWRGGNGLVPAFRGIDRFNPGGRAEGGGTGAGPGERQGSEGCVLRARAVRPLCD
ncbi:MAG: hypothetical protein IT545_01190 [Rhodobacteraceae bacterium]|nr:hypothetical protein [Paracoccaceae bacterium]